MKLVEKMMNERTELNLTANGGVHYNGVVIVEVWDDFISIEPGDAAMRSAGQFRGGKTYVNIATITRLDDANVTETPAGKIRGNLLGRQ
jgi:hypothetical protein